jgi:LysR family transcriptional regulator of abg operon
VQLRQLEHFEAVYRLRSFTRAAQEQYLSQSALSRSIQALEEELGQPLFDRSSHAVEPTDAAEALIGHAVDAIASARELIETARLLRDGEGGAVAIGTGPYPAQPLMTRVVRSLSADHPGLQVTVAGGAASDLLAALVRRELDFVVCDISKAEESPVASEIEVVALPPEPLAVVVGREHPLVGTDPTPSQVARHPFVLPPPAPIGRRVLARSFGPGAAPSRMPFYEVESTAACLEVVQDQRSVTLVPVSLARQECPARGLAFRLAGRGQATHDGVHVLRARTLGASARIACDVVLTEAAALAADTREWRRSVGTVWQLP